MRKLSLVGVILVVFLAVAVPGFAQEDDPGTIADVVTAAAEADESQFTVLLSALQAADSSVLEKLADPEADITVFAPTDEAFNTLGEEALNAILEDEELLTDLLLYHVIEGTVSSADVTDMDGETVTTLQGSPIEIRVEDETIFVNEAEVVTPDMEASNGVIHVIDAVLMPPTEAAATEEAVAVATEEATAEPEATATEEIAATEEATAEPETVATEETAAVATEEAVVAATEEATAEPEATEEAAAGNTIADVVSTDSQFTTLLSAVQAADPSVLGRLSDPNAQLTLFAPTDEAFEALGEEELNALLADSGNLTNTLLYHVVNGKVLLADITAAFESEEDVDGLVAQTLLTGNALLITQDEEGNYYVNGAKIITTDIETANGIIHVVEAVITLPEAE
ncbi:MAG: fasciclin domain-containing protein [Anaerolineae bacterium]|nr:fasciclin domain-containing protein [Anaerolineae bacterium]